VKPRACLLAALAAGLVSCSSAPKNQDQVFEQKNRAAELARFGNDYYRKGDLDQAQRFFTMALAYNAAADNRAGLAETYNSLGKVALARGANDEATRQFAEALRIGEELGDPSLVAKAQNNFGEAAFARGEFVASLELFVKALAARGLAETDRAVMLHNQGSALRRLGRSPEAEALFREALAINVREKVWSEAASNYYMLASVESERGQYARAEDMAREALASDRKVENSRGIANDYVALGRLAARAGDSEKALDYFGRAVLVYRSLAAVEPRADVRAGLHDAARQAAETAERLGRADVARGYRDMLQEGEPSR